MQTQLQDLLRPIKTHTLDLLTTLRQRTREQHGRLDAGIDFGSKAWGRERYAAFLGGVLDVVSSLEPAVERWLGPLSNPSRVACLRADLARLGIPEGGAPQAPHAVHSLAAAYGCVYVLEGSALGGLVLAPAVEAAIGPEAPTSYLRLRGANTPRAWRAWLERLREYGAAASPTEVDDACTAACRTFDAYSSSLALHGALTQEPACTP